MQRTRSIRQDQHDRGFTLIELLVVVIIVGILAAIAVPQFARQRERAVDAALRNDLRHAVTAIEDWTGEGRSWSDLRTAVSSPSTHYVQFVGPGVTPLSYPLWPTSGDVQPVKLSRGSIVNMNIYRTASGSRPAHSDGDYCLLARNARSSFNYTGGSDPSALARQLYFDRQLGAVVTIREIAQAQRDGKPVSCVAQGDMWRSANP